MLFKDMKLIAPIQQALKAENYNKLTPIQEKAIPSMLAGRDVLGCAQTGTGKTAAFAVPILQNLSQGKRAKKDTKQVRALILAPTRELAVQIAESFESYGMFLKLKTLVVYGGVSQNYQIEALGEGVDILVATPGRLLDLMEQGFVLLDQVEAFVLDEADRMLDMGMLQDVKKIIAQLPRKRQSMLFSATMPQEVSQLVNTILTSPVKIDVKQNKAASKPIKQGVYYVDETDKVALLIHLLKNKAVASALVFARTKQRADKVVSALVKEGIKAQAIHGDKSQAARETALNSFKNKELRVLAATDVAARGIDVEELTHVINFDLPNIPETYVHRIGRTGRAGMGGTALTFCSNQERQYLKDIEKLLGKSIEIIRNHPYPLMNMVLEQNRGLAKETHRGSKAKPGSKGNQKQWDKKGKAKGK